MRRRIWRRRRREDLFDRLSISHGRGGLGLEDDLSFTFSSQVLPPHPLCLGEDGGRELEEGAMVRLEQEVDRMRVKKGNARR